MAHFLSDEWIEDLATALADVELAEGAVDVVVQQHVDGAASYWIAVVGRRLRVGPGVASGADITFSCDLDTASAISRGERNAQDAFAAGHLRFAGDVTVLLREAPVLARASEALAGLRARTSY